MLISRLTNLTEKFDKDFSTLKKREPSTFELLIEISNNHHFIIKLKKYNI